MTQVTLLLCVRHGAQVAGNLEAPTGNCHPRRQWITAQGLIQECEARNGLTPKILEFIAQKKAQPQS